MAYSDYGAFVYKNGERRHDREDALPYVDGDENIPAGHRIYMNLIAKIQENEQDEKHDEKLPGCLTRTFHGVMGDGATRLCMYKNDVRLAYAIHDNGDGTYDVIDGEKLVALAIGDDFVPYISHIDDEDPKEFLKRYDAWEDHDKYNQQFDSAYEYSVVWHDVSMTFIKRDYASDDSIEILPQNIARMTDINGDEWVCGYDSLYGSGLTDEDENDERYKRIEGDMPPEVHMLNVRYSDAEIDDGTLVGAQTIVTLEENRDDGHAELLYRGQSIIDFDNADVLTKSTLCDNAYINGHGYIDILNQGIRLANRGISQVQTYSSDFGKQLDDWDADKMAYTRNGLVASELVSIYHGIDNEYYDKWRSTIVPDAEKDLDQAKEAFFFIAELLDKHQNDEAFCNTIRGMLSTLE